MLFKHHRAGYARNESSDRGDDWHKHSRQSVVHRNVVKRYRIGTLARVVRIFSDQRKKVRSSFSFSCQWPFQERHGALGSQVLPALPMKDLRILQRQPTTAFDFADNIGRKTQSEKWRCR